MRQLLIKKNLPLYSLLAALCVLSAAAAAAADTAAPSPFGIVIDETVVYTVVKGDTLELIGAKLGADWRRLARQNGINPKRPLRTGQQLTTQIRRIVPKTMDRGIVVNIPEKILYFFRDGVLEDVIPVGVGRPVWRGVTRWRTPASTFKVTGKQKNPTWYVPKSMQWKMEQEGEEVKTVVPPGPDNPLGRYKISTSLPGIVIHETIWPSSVYQFRSHGCIRIMPERMEGFFKKVEISMPGELLYQPVKVARTQEGKVFLEIHEDVYGKVRDLKAEARRLIEAAGLAGSVDWEHVDRVVREKSGTAEEVGGWSPGEVF